MKEKLDDFDKFTMNVFKLACDRKLMNRFNKSEIIGKIKQIPSYKKAILIPTLYEDLEKELAKWNGSKNLFVILSMVKELQNSSCSNEPSNTNENCQNSNDQEEVQEEEESEGGFNNNLLEGLKRYEELVLGKINVSIFKKWIDNTKFFGNAKNYLQNISDNIQYGIYSFKKWLKSTKDRLDNASYEVFSIIIDYTPEGIHKTVFLCILWLLLKVTSVTILLFIIITRPSVLFELLGFDEDDLPIFIE